ncbi:hypothetical protein NGY2020056_05680 [Vibrio cholerae]
MFRQTEANKLVAESDQETNAIEVSDGNRGKTVGKKISWYSRGDYTTGVNDTFACCRSGMTWSYHLWNSCL